MTPEQKALLASIVDQAKTELLGVAARLKDEHAAKLKEFARLAGDVALGVIGGMIGLGQAQHDLHLLVKTGRNVALVAAREADRATAEAATRWLEFVATTAAKLLLA